MCEFHVVIEGFSSCEGESVVATGTSTLVVTEKNKILIDTGSPWERERLINKLMEHNVKMEDITWVVCTHGHLDHIGNLNLFPNANFICCFDVLRNHKYVPHDFQHGMPYMLEKCVEVAPMPGHTATDVVVFLRDVADKGIVAVVGDLFEKAEDLEDSVLWKRGSALPKLQARNRAWVLREANWIVPGHGAAFEVTTSMKQLTVDRMLSASESVEMQTESSSDVISGDDKADQSSVVVEEAE